MSVSRCCAARVRARTARTEGAGRCGRDLRAWAIAARGRPCAPRPLLGGIRVRPARPRSGSAGTEGAFAARDDCCPRRARGGGRGRPAAGACPGRFAGARVFLARESVSRPGRCRGSVREYARAVAMHDSGALHFTEEFAAGLRPAQVLDLRGKPSSDEGASDWRDDHAGGRSDGDPRARGRHFPHLNRLRSRGRNRTASARSVRQRGRQVWRGAARDRHPINAVIGWRISAARGELAGSSERSGSCAPVRVRSGRSRFGGYLPVEAGNWRSTRRPQLREAVEVALDQVARCGRTCAP